MKRAVNNTLGVCLALAGLILAFAGLALGQNAQMLQKAVNICLECIGIG